MRRDLDGAMGADEKALLRAVERALAGDERAMDSLYRRFRYAVLGCALRIVKDEHEAEDITQQVFLKLLTSLRTFVPARGSFQGWLMRIARNTALDHVRRNRAIPAAEVFGPDVVAPPPRSPVWPTLDAALAEVPLRQRHVLILTYLGFRPAEIARQMQVSEGAVHLLHHRARKRLLVRLSSEGVAPMTRA
jgi:RNA polymerase sigma-70 factor (ECF subfamily)